MDDTNHFERFFDYFNVKLFALGRSVPLFFCHVNAKLPPKHCIIINFF